MVSDNLTEVNMSECEALQRETELKALSINNDIYSAEHERTKQQKRHRTWFFYWSLAVITVVILSSAGKYFWRMKATGGEPEEVVIVGWLTTTLVGVVVLGYIIADSLFQSSNGDTAASSMSLHLSRKLP